MYELLVRGVQLFEEVDDEGQLLVVVAVEDRGQRHEQPGRFCLVLPGRDDEDPPPVLLLVPDATDVAAAFEPVERRAGSRGAQPGDLG